MIPDVMGCWICDELLVLETFGHFGIDNRSSIVGWWHSGMASQPIRMHFRGEKISSP